MTFRRFVAGRDVIPLDDALDWLYHQSRGATPNPRRRAYRMARDALVAIAHKHDLSDVPPDKLDRLIDQAAQACGWDRPPSKLRKCSECERLKPDDEFRRRATPGERQRYGWFNRGNARWVSDSRCAACRRNVQRRAEYAKGKAEERDLPTALAMERHLSRRYLTAYKSWRRACIAYGRGDPLSEFHGLRAVCLREAKEEMRRRIDEAPTLVTPSHENWQDLLTDERRRQLLTALNALPRMRGRPIRI